MKIGMLTWGSDGDIRPFIALSGKLSSAGHDVTLAVFSVDKKNYSQFAEKLNFKIQHISSVDPEVYDEKLSYMIEEFYKNRNKNSLVKLKIVLYSVFFPVIDELYSASKQLCKENDVLIGHFLIHPLKIAAKKMNRPYITVSLNHSGLYSKFVTPTGFPNLGKIMNFVWWKLVKAMINSISKEKINEFCVKEGEAPFSDVLREVWESETLSLIAVSSIFCKPQPDWPDHRHLCGFFNMSEQFELWQIPEDLEKFFNSGPPPVYMTFGSMTISDLELFDVTKLMIEAAEMAGTRAIIQSRWDKLTDIPENLNIYRITKAPHQFLFPRCYAVVHHGGSGTTQTATRYGCPSIVVEHFGDQWFWGKELQRLGIAPDLLHRSNLTAEKLAKSLKTVINNSKMKQRAGNLGKIMRQENGAGKAVELIERQFKN